MDDIVKNIIYECLVQNILRCQEGMMLISSLKVRKRMTDSGDNENLKLETSNSDDKFSYD